MSNFEKKNISVGYEKSKESSNTHHSLNLAMKFQNQKKDAFFPIISPAALIRDYTVIVVLLSFSNSCVFFSILVFVFFFLFFSTQF